MSKQAVTVSVAGHAYRLVTSLDALKERASARILDMVQRVDTALDHLDEEAEPLDGSDSEGVNELRDG